MHGCRSSTGTGRIAAYAGLSWDPHRTFPGLNKRLLDAAFQSSARKDVKHAASPRCTLFTPAMLQP